MFCLKALHCILFETSGLGTPKIFSGIYIFKNPYKNLLRSFNDLSIHRTERQRILLSYVECIHAYKFVYKKNVCVNNNIL